MVRLSNAGPAVSVSSRVTFHLRLARKRLIFPLLRDLVALRVRGVNEAIHAWARDSVHDSLHLQCKKWFISSLWFIILQGM